MALKLLFGIDSDIEGVARRMVANHARQRNRIEGVTTQAAYFRTGCYECGTPVWGPAGQQMKCDSCRLEALKEKELQPF